MNLLTIVIPVLNEEEIVEQSLNKLSQLESEDIKIIVCDGGSTDRTPEIVDNFINKTNWKYIYEKIESPSILKTIKLSCDQTNSSYTLVLPIDCLLDIKIIKSLCEILKINEFDYGCFYKSYLDTNFIMTPYCLIQNIIRTKLFKNMVWTNGIWLKSDLLKNSDIFKEMKLLEDVCASDNLKKAKLKSKIIKDKIKVSARRYYSTSTLKQIFTNLLIISLYRLGYKDSLKLKSIYQRIK